MRQKLPWLRILVEGAVIVVSVLLALAADAWWDGHQERSLESEYYERLLYDLVRDSSTVERILHFNDVYRRSALELIPVAAGEARPQDDPIEDAHRLAWAGFLLPQSLFSATFDEMVSSGRLRLIDNLDLSGLLLGYYDAQGRRETYLQGAPRELSELARRWLPAGFTRAAQQCLWEEWPGLGGSGVARCRAEISLAESTRVMSQLRGEPEAGGYLREVVWFADHVEAAFAFHLNQNAELMRELRRTIERM